jgi:hypothetical protein
MHPFHFNEHFVVALEVMSIHIDFDSFLNHSREAVPKIVKYDCSFFPFFAGTPITNVTTDLVPDTYPLFEVS